MCECTCVCAHVCLCAGVCARVCVCVRSLLLTCSPSDSSFCSSFPMQGAATPLVVSRAKPVMTLDFTS